MGALILNKHRILNSHQCKIFLIFRHQPGMRLMGKLWNNLRRLYNGPFRLQSTDLHLPIALHMTFFILGLVFDTFRTWWSQMVSDPYGR